MAATDHRMQTPPSSIKNTTTEGTFFGAFELNLTVSIGCTRLSDSEKFNGNEAYMTYANPHKRAGNAGGYVDKRELSTGREQGEGGIEIPMASMRCLLNAHRAPRFALGPAEAGETRSTQTR
jgi:hypothetical protein